MQETENLMWLSEKLSSKIYTPANLDSFMVYEPKKREINAPAFRDKVIQRGLTDFVVYPALSPSIPHNSFAAQTGKGQHYGLDMLEKHMRTYFLRRKGRDEQIRKEHGLPYRDIEDWDYSDGWVIKGDIRKCFPSTSHEKLKSLVYPKLPNQDFCNLLGLYIDQVDGLALGHQTSHICAVFFISTVLHFINQELKCSLSGMYMDDWYVIVETKEQARMVLQAVTEKFADIDYDLNEKTGIFPLRHGIDFCGFHVYITKTGKVIRKLRQSSKKKIKRRIKKWEKEYKEGLISKEEIETSFQSSCAHYKHGDTTQLVRKLRKRVNDIYKEEY